MEITTTENRKQWLPAVILALYTILLVTVMVFHEPWYDEAQSWLIARDASFSDMLFTIPHYEGHPPLWWLILAVPAKLGAPYEIGLKSVQAAFAVFGVYLILFKSPFPVWFRALLPFSYFLFYQYGVLARPYSMLFCAICLAAITWKKRDENPFRFVLSLMFLCLSSAYGILTAGGIAIAWTFDALRAGTLFKNIQRLLALSLLLAHGVLLLLVLLPREDTMAVNLHLTGQANTFPQRLFYFLFCLPAEATFTAFGNDTILQLFFPEITAVICMSVVSVAIWAIMLAVTYKKRTLHYLIIPYLLMALFGSWKYYTFHHLGILFHLFLFAAWISMGHGMITRPRYSKVIAIMLIAGLAMNLYWTTFASITDITSNYSPGKQLAAYVRNKHLEHYNWISLWDQDRDDNGKVIYENTHKCYTAVVEANAYLQEPLTGIQAGGTSYVDHIVPSREQMDSEIEQLAQRGVDVIIGFPYGGNFMDQLRLKDEKFVMAEIIESDAVWKDKHKIDDLFIIVREELAGVLN